MGEDVEWEVAEGCYTLLNCHVTPTKAGIQAYALTLAPLLDR